MIAALFVDAKGIYSGHDDIDVWDERRDARLYPGPYPVVAHPPCSRWCRLAGLVEARWGHKRGDDGGCFEAALNSVRTYGGVLEHPAYSDAWLKYDLPPPIVMGWQKGICGGWVCHVEQAHYGHVAKKATWLYAYGVNPESLPSLNWSRRHDRELGLVSWCGNHTKASDKSRPRVGKKAASSTPTYFCRLLVELAHSVGHNENPDPTG